MKIIYLYIRTLLNLKFIQFYYLIYYRIFRKVFIPKYSYNQYKRGIKLNFDSFIHKPITVRVKSIEFLNQKLFFKSLDDIRWNKKYYGKLWTYNLNYMDYLNQKSLHINTKKKVLFNYINSFASNKVGHEPYTISLRLVNWIKFISLQRLNFNNIELKKIDTSIFSQMLILNKNIEYNIQGNHLLENSISLLFISFYFNDFKLFVKAKKLLLNELNKQILDDGGHFELSVMYHKIILERLLDCINLLSHNKLFKKQYELEKEIKFKIKLMISWLKNMTYKNDTYPLFNDSAKNIASSSSKLINYYNKYFKESLSKPLTDSGYRRFNSKFYDCIIDIGKIGPKYQMGHSHADTFNFDLLLNNKKIISNFGISTYDENKIRLNEKSTKSKNTVTINNLNSSEIWSSFRVANSADIELIKDENNIVSAQHNGFKYIGYKHRRSWLFHEKYLKIYDKIISSNFLKNLNTEPNIIGNFWFDPNIKIKQKENILFFDYGKIIFKNCKNINITKKTIPNGFNSSQMTNKVEVSFKSILETKIIFK